MPSAILCILLCLGSLSVMGQVPGVLRRPGHHPRPSPSGQMPWPGQQCINSKLGYVGICAGTPNMCSSLICAYPNGRGGFVPGRYRAALPGTVCGPFMVCRNRQCVPGDITNMPQQIGRRAIVQCNRH